LLFSKTALIPVFVVVKRRVNAPPGAIKESARPKRNIVISDEKSEAVFMLFGSKFNYSGLTPMEKR
jgi:hypothetical protein